MASNYLDYVGTEKLSAQEIKQQFYKLACNYSVNVNGDNLNISLSGLSENMPAALKLMEDVLHNAKADKESYAQFVDLMLKARDDSKKDQRTCFDYLYYYNVYGPHNMRRDDMTEKQLREADPQELLNLLGNLSTKEHKVLYYGPMSEKELSNLLSKEHKTPKYLMPVSQGEPFVEQKATENQVVIAPYDAKNIYMRMYHNEGRTWNPDEAAVQEVFNEYYGGGMNGIVFQEMREARGLAYNAYARYYSPSEKDRKEYYFTHIITQNDKMVDCISHFHDILNEMPASETAFQIAKDAVTKRLASARTTKSAVIYSYLAAQKLGLNISTNELIYKNLDKVQLKDIVNFEKNNMANKAYRYIILGDEKELDMKYLEGLGTIKRLSLEEVFGY
jgi:predicted Zn-dependent peptidase